MKAAVKAVHPEADCVTGRVSYSVFATMPPPPFDPKSLLLGRGPTALAAWIDAYAKLPAPDAQGGDETKPLMPAHDYARQWASDTLSGKIGGRFEWGERNLAKCYLDLLKEPRQTREDGIREAASCVPFDREAFDYRPSDLDFKHAKLLAWCRAHERVAIRETILALLLPPQEGGNA
jgi:hypothetical protein